MQSNFYIKRLSLWNSLYERLQGSALASRFLRGAFWGVITAAASRILSLFASILIARLLGKEGFGQLGVIQSTIMMFGTFAGLGLGLTATKYISEYRNKDISKTGRLMGLCMLVGLGSGLAIGAVVMIMAPWLASTSLADPGLTNMLRIGALLILLSGINGTQTGALAGFEAFKRIAQVSFYSGLANFTLMVAGTLAFGLEGTVWGLAGAGLVNVWLNHLALRKEAWQAGVPLTLAGSMQEWKILASFSLPALLSGMLAAPVNWVCAAMLVQQAGGYAEMGVWNAANQWFYLVLFIPSALVSNSMPIFSERMANGDHGALRTTLGYSIKLNTLIVFPIVIFGCLASPYIMGSYGRSFQEHWAVLILALLAGGVMALQVPMGQIVIATGRMWLLTWMQLLWALLVCVGTWWLISYGALGLVIARLGGYVVHTLITLIVVHKYLKG